METLHRSVAVIVDEAHTQMLSGTSSRGVLEYVARELGLVQEPMRELACVPSLVFGSEERRLSPTASPLPSPTSSSPTPLPLTHTSSSTATATTSTSSSSATTNPISAGQSTPSKNVLLPPMRRSAIEGRKAFPTVAQTPSGTVAKKGEEGMSRVWG